MVGGVSEALCCSYLQGFILNYKVLRISVLDKIL